MGHLATQRGKRRHYYGDDVTAAVVTRYSAYALKFAIILTAVNGEWGCITENAMQTAIYLADGYKATVYRILSEKESFGISGAKLQRVLRMIQRHAGSGITTKALQQGCNMRKHELRPCLDKLIQIGAIDSRQAGRGFRYIPLTAGELPIKTWK